MARATRSTTQHQEKESATTTAPVTPRTKTASKKRKRISGLDADDQPATKQLRTDQSTVTIKDEQGSQEPEPAPEAGGSGTHLQLPNAGDVPIDLAEAEKILDILEMIDTQGLLDRVFPLHSDVSTSPQSSYSFRTLLKESSRHPLRVLHSAVQHLLPISSHPRSKPSVPAAQQLRFCNLALSLLDQASFHSVPIPLDLESILPPTPDSPPASSTPAPRSEDDSKPSQPTSTSTLVQASPLPPKRKYALMQRLATGDWWSSLNSDFALPPSDGRELKDLPTAHAELVAILPSPSTSLPITTSSSISVQPKATTSVVQTLGSYNSKKPPGPKPKISGPRRVSCGTFLDYGVYASFAPSFDQDGKEVGRGQLGEVICGSERRRREREAARRALVEGRGTIVEVPDATEDVEMSNAGGEVIEVEKSKEVVNVAESLGELLPPGDVAAIQAALGNLDLENAVHELLERNRRALERLEELQVLRLTKEDGGSSVVEEGTEEWDTAQGILDSLTILASLRPRSSADESEIPPLIPPSAVLRKLHLTLPLAPSPGWHGTLPPSRTTALRDDSTLKVRSGAVANPVNITASVPTPAPTTTAATTPIPTTYTGYSYANYSATQQQQYRPVASTTTPYAYKPGQTPAPAYYQGAYATTAQQAGQISQVGQQSYYGAQNYSSGATGQQPYAYTSWYNYPPPVAVAGGTSSGRGTPQPGIIATPATMPTTYGGFFSGTGTPQPQLQPQPQPQGQPQVPQQQQQRTPAVANTVANKGYQGQAAQGTWATGTYAQAQPQGQSVVPTLPVHLRSTSAQPSPVPAPGTPTPGGVAGYQQQPSYYGAYQQPATPAAR